MAISALRQNTCHCEGACARGNLPVTPSVIARALAPVQSPPSHACHCEERSDVAIRSPSHPMSLRASANTGVAISPVTPSVIARRRSRRGNLPVTRMSLRGGPAGRRGNLRTASEHLSLRASANTGVAISAPVTTTVIARALAPVAISPVTTLSLRGAKRRGNLPIRICRGRLRHIDPASHRLARCCASPGG